MPHRAQRLAMGGGLGLILLGVSLIVLVWVVPISEPVPQSTSHSLKQEEKLNSPPKELQELDYSPLYAKRFQRPLVDPPPPAVVETPPPPPPSFRVVAIMVERGGNQAMLQDPQGNLAVKKVGDTISDAQSSAEIVSIESSRVVLKHFESLVELSIGP